MPWKINRWTGKSLGQRFREKQKADLRAARAHIAAEARAAQGAHDPVNHPAHYTSHPSGIEAIQIAEHFNFCLGNVFKYVWRAGQKADAIEDLKKARWYLDREIAKREKEANGNG